jgi:hypothetical protein
LCRRCDPQFLSALLMRLRVVYYMPSEEVMRKGDLSRELCFVLHGACHLMEDDKIHRVVRHDVRGHPPPMHSPPLPPHPPPLTIPLVATGICECACLIAVCVYAQQIPRFPIARTPNQ